MRFYGRSYFTLVVRKTPRLIKNTQDLLPQNLLNLRYIYGPGMRFLWKSQNHVKFIKIGYKPGVGRCGYLVTSKILIFGNRWYR